MKLYRTRNCDIAFTKPIESETKQKKNTTNERFTFISPFFWLDEVPTAAIL